MRRAKAKVKKESSERWLLTYSDLITLLMAFFVIMYAMSNVSESKFNALATQLSIAFNAGPGVLSGGTGMLPTPYELETNALESAAEAVESAASDQNVALEVEVTMRNDGVLIRMKDALMFRPGSANLTPAAKAFLDQIAVQIKPMKNHIRIEGHTDNIPLTGGTFRSNFELSAIRAANVLEYLVKTHSVDSSRLEIAGLGEFSPIADNSTPEGRSRNRRVEIFIARMETNPDAQTSNDR